VPASEQAFYLWYFVLGSFAVLCLSRLLTELNVAPWLRKLIAAATKRPGLWIAAMALLAFAASLGFRLGVLFNEAIADDEATYRFIARTLLAGRVTNPIPDDAEFFGNRFIVINAHGWHGKYPIGHPLVLALGEAVGAIDVMMPLCGALCVWLAYRVGRKLFDDRVALVGASLLVLSPHFVWTCGTLLSQPTLSAVLLAGMLLTLRGSEDPRWRWTLLAGCLFGFAFLVRPLPGGLFAVVGALQVLLDARGARARFGRLFAFGAGALPWLLVFLAANYAQSGSVFTSGYQEAHGGLKVLYNDQGQVVNSLVGGLLRENFWLLGWTFALLLLSWCRPGRQWVYWGMLGAELLYRVIAPKTVVASTGPIYLTEVVPLLTLGVADGLSRLGRALPQLGVRPAVVALSATLIAAGMFVPIPLVAVATGASTRHVVHDELRKAGAERALIFANSAVYPQGAVTWAYLPDYPSPKLDDDVLFVRVPVTEQPRAKMIEFWRRRFADRRAFVFAWSREGPHFEEL
jgi:hypothetical protein